MKLGKKIWLLLGMALVIVSGVKADQIRLHPTYADYLTRIIDTPKYTYLLSKNQPYVLVAPEYAVRTGSLFRYDKKEKETQWLNTTNLLSDPVVIAAEYNYDKNYLLVAYENGDIDLLYDDGTVKNVPGLKVADSSYSKIINSITFIPGSDEVFLATPFGFVTVDERSGQIGRSRSLNRNISAAVEFDGKIYVGSADGLFTVSNLGGAEMTQVPGFGEVRKMMAVGDKLFIHTGGDVYGRIDFFTKGSQEQNNMVASIPILDVESGKDKILIGSTSDIWIWDVTPGGQISHYTKPADIAGKKTVGCDGRKFWVDNGAHGLRMVEGQPDGGAWTPIQETIIPNASNAFISTQMAYSDKYGMLVRPHGVGYNFTSIVPFPPDYLSGLKNGVWTPLSLTVNAPELLPVLNVFGPNGVAVDPLDKDVVYCGSVLTGMLRLNLADNSKSLRFGCIDDPAVGNANFIGCVIPPTAAGITTYTSLGAPTFDNYGYMWMSYHNINDRTQELWYWSPEDRKATTSSSSFRPFKKWTLEGVGRSQLTTVLPLKTAANKNILVISVQGGGLMVIDHNGTIDNRADDKIYIFTDKVYDADGNIIEFDYYRALCEDPSSGNVWVGTSNGVFWFNPHDLPKSGDTKVNRIKVPRNDGTNYADYLLNEAMVNVIAVDPKGRKWFGTNGAGLTVSSASGTQILKSFTTENSYLPSDAVYGLCYNPENETMMVSTANGLAEVSLSSSSVGNSDDDGAVIWPNPVRPDYYGYVNIENLEEGALVKINDSAGNLVKELGFAEDGTIQWDVTNYNNKRVRSGVYYVLASGGPQSSGYGVVGKILVVN